MMNGATLDGALLTVNGNRSTIEITDGITFTGQFATRSAHDLNIVDTTPAQISTSMGIGLMGLVTGDGTLRGQGTESPKTADVDNPALGEQNTVVLQRINGVWTLMDREAVCKSAAIPASLAQLGCYSN